MNFKALGLIEPLINAVQKMGYEEPTPIQAQTIPVILRSNDLLASAQTGTGKTASFVLPILQLTNQKPLSKPRNTRVLILTPTRELAAQVFESLVRLGHYLPLRTAVVFGGVKINPQINKLSAGVELLVATPGRLLDLQQQGALRLDGVDTLVLDEADRMLDMGFIHDIRRIIKLLPENRQTLMFSATFTKEIRTLAKSILHQPMEIDVAPRNTSAVSVKQYIHPVDKKRKHALLSHLIHKNKWGQTLVFSRTKHGANKLVKQLAESQIHSVAIHGNKTQSQRTKALADFKMGKVHILVATDIAARGIDIEKLPCVVNFDLPQVPEDYVHRIGRTGRAGETGLAVSLVSADEVAQLQSIEKLMKQKLERINIDDFEPQHHLPISVVTSSQNKPGINKKGSHSSNHKARKTFRRRTKKV